MVRCPVSPDQLICLFRSRLRMDNEDAEPPSIPEMVQVITTIRRTHAAIRELLFVSKEKNPKFVDDMDRALG